MSDASDEDAISGTESATVNAREYSRLLRSHNVSALTKEPYVPGHCFPQAFARSSLHFRSFNFSASDVRRELGKLYKNWRWYRVLSNGLTADLGKLQPGNEQSLLEYQSDVDRFLRCEYGAEVALSEEETEKYCWVPRWFQERASMIISTDCSVSTSNLWIYNTFPDNVALVAASCRRFFWDGILRVLDASHGPL